MAAETVFAGPIADRTIHFYFNRARHAIRQSRQCVRMTLLNTLSASTRHAAENREWHKGKCRCRRRAVKVRFWSERDPCALSEYGPMTGQWRRRAELNTADMAFCLFLHSLSVTMDINTYTQTAHSAHSAQRRFFIESLRFIFTQTL